MAISLSHADADENERKWAKMSVYAVKNVTYLMLKTKLSSEESISGAKYAHALI